MPYFMPFTQAKRGGLANTDAADLLAAVFKGVLDKTGVDPKASHGTHLKLKHRHVAISDYVHAAIISSPNPRPLAMNL